MELVAKESMNEPTREFRKRIVKRHTVTASAESQGRVEAVRDIRAAPRCDVPGSTRIALSVLKTSSCRLRGRRTSPCGRGGSAVRRPRTPARGRARSPRGAAARRGAARCGSRGRDRSPSSTRPRRYICSSRLGWVAYTELHAHSAYSFLDGASQPEELAARAAELGYDGARADRPRRGLRLARVRARGEALRRPGDHRARRSRSTGGPT